MNAGWGVWLFAALLLAGLVLLVVVAVRLLYRGTSGPDSNFTARAGHYPAAPSATQARRGAREILEDRYARGEIDSEEYRERQRTLEGND